MKMKEVCEKSGLTERAVRFYIEKQLISPETTEINGRSYTEFCQKDVEELRVISDLRKIEFSIEEILTMKNTPERIGEILNRYKVNLVDEVNGKAQLINALNRLDLSSIHSAQMLAMRLRAVSASRPNPDVRLNFDKMEDMEASEKEQEYQAFLYRQREQSQRGEKIVIGIIVLTLVLEVISLFQRFNVFGLFIQIALCVGLYKGYSWVRYLLAGASLLGAFLNIAGAVQASSSGYDIGGFTVALIIGLVILGIVQGLVLFMSKSVDAFLYSQKNG